MHTSTQAVSQQRSTLLLIQMAVCALAVVSLLYIPIPILPLLASAYQLSGDHAGLALSAFAIAYACGFMVFGPLSDRLGRRTVLIAGLTLLVIVSLGLMWVHTAELFIAGRALQGFAAASFPPVALAYLTERGTPAQRAWGVAWLSTAFLAAGLIGQIYGSVVAARWGLSWALVPLVMIYTLTALMLVRAPASHQAPRPHPSLWTGYRQIPSLLNNPDLRRVYFPALLLLMSFVAFYMSIDIHLGSALQAQGISALHARGIALPAFLAPLLAPALIGRWGAQRVVTAGLTLACVGLGLCASAGSAHLSLLLAASVVYVAGVAISVPGLIARIGAVTLPEVRGLAVAFYTFVLFIGASVGPWLANSARAWPIESVFLILAASLGVAAIVSVTRERQYLPVR